MRALDEDTTRLFERLSVRPQYSTLPDEIRQQAVIEARDQFLDYTNRDTYPGERADSIVCDLAAAWINRLGWEGMSKAEDGDLHREINVTQDTALALRMDAWRKPMYPRSTTE